MKKLKVSWLVEVQTDKTTGDLYIEFPFEMLERLNIKEKDRVIWEEQKDGSFKLIKLDDNS
jgi:hypothetical protein